jgi:hypothetical protein
MQLQQFRNIVQPLRRSAAFLLGVGDILDAFNSAHYIASNDRRIGDNEEGTGSAIIQILSGCFPERPWKETENVRVAGVPSEIRIEHLTNTCLERNRYTNLFSFSVVKDRGYIQACASVHMSQINQWRHRNLVWDSDK